MPALMTDLHMTSTDSQTCPMPTCSRPVSFVLSLEGAFEQLIGIFLRDVTSTVRVLEMHPGHCDTAAVPALGPFSRQRTRFKP